MIVEVWGNGIPEVVGSEGVSVHSRTVVVVTFCTGVRVCAVNALVSVRLPVPYLIIITSHAAPQNI